MAQVYREGVPGMPLPYQSVALAIGRGQVACCYLLAGPDGLQRRTVVQALAARVPDIGVQRLDGAACSPAEVVGLLRTPTFVPGRLIIVEEPPWVVAPKGAAAAEPGEDEGAARGPRKGAGKARAAPEQPLLAYLDAPARGATLVLATAAEPDRRRRLTRKATERGVHVACVAPRDPSPWLRERCSEIGLQLARELFAVVAQRLAGATCERMASELDKLAAHGPGLDRAGLDLLLPPDREERIFDLVDAAVAGQAVRALTLAAALLAQREPVARLLYLLGGQLRTIVIVAEACGGGKRPEAVAGGLGLHPFVARKALDQSRRLHAPAVAVAAEAVWEAELGLKTGALDEGPALDHAVLGIVAAAGHLAPRPARAGSRPAGGEVPAG